MLVRHEVMRACSCSKYSSIYVSMPACVLARTQYIVKPNQQHIHCILFLLEFNFYENQLFFNDSTASFMYKQYLENSKGVIK